MNELLIGLGALVVIFGSTISIYNSLIKKRNDIDNAFGSIDAMLKKRYDLIPNLVETVKQYMTHERSILTEITQLRVDASSDDISNEEKIDIENKISSRLGGVMVAVENYPDLKANTNFIQLQRSWNEVEEQISASRRFFNSAVTEYNTAIQSFPNSIFAAILKFKQKKVFEIQQNERENISAKNLFDS